MKKQILKFGKALSKAEQRNVFGGNIQEGQTCKIYHDDDMYYLVLSSMDPNDPAASTRANEKCVEDIANGLTTSCHYDCGHDGYGQ